MYQEQYLGTDQDFDPNGNTQCIGHIAMNQDQNIQPLND